MSIGKHRNSLSALIVFRAKTLNFKLKVIARTLNRAPVVSASAVFTEALYCFAIATSHWRCQV
jgi:hypothetical protein